MPAVCPSSVVRGGTPWNGVGQAAQQLGRRVVGVELEERYCEVAARRLAQVLREVPGRAA